MIKVCGFIGSDFNDFTDLTPPHNVLVVISLADKIKIETFTKNKCSRNDNNQKVFAVSNKLANNAFHNILRVKLLKKSELVGRAGERILRADIMNRDVELELHPTKFKYKNEDGVYLEGIKFSIIKLTIK